MRRSFGHDLYRIVGAVLTVKAEIHYVIHDSLPFAEGTGGQFKAVEPPHIVEQLPPQVAVMAVVENEQEGVFMKQINTLGPDVRYVERHEIKPQRDVKAVVKLVMKSLIFLDGTQTRDARVRQRIAEVKAERYLMDEVAITAKKAKRRLGIDDGNTGDEENRRPGPIIFGQTGDEFDTGYKINMSVSIGMWKISSRLREQAKSWLASVIPDGIRLGTLFLLGGDSMYGPVSNRGQYRAGI
ncbi:hypothetical protein C8J57DRAFT_1251989 [Mycena rebaudengoi]|nr:hypothetical protein C8J57DRAFT_1251989 [Mycena rebaudengoi]